MSRIRGIEAKGQKDVPAGPTRRNGAINIADNKKKADDLSKEEAEKQQMRSLAQKLPQLDALLQLERKIGEGTFSSVYVGWARAHAGLPPEQRRRFAVKHLVPTAHPARVEHELRCLQDIGGKDHVIGVDLCLRNLDTIVFVMPYLPHRKFSEYMGCMSAGELRGYMRALLRALRRVHSFGVIHRDVKPSNFLYDRENKRYMLVDFGLAQRIGGAAAGDTRVSVQRPPALPAPAPAAAPAAALAAALAPPPAHLTSLKRSREQPETSSPPAKRAALDLTLRARAPAPAPSAPAPSAPAPAPAPAPLGPRPPPPPPRPPPPPPPPQPPQPPPPPTPAPPAPRVSRLLKLSLWRNNRIYHNRRGRGRGRGGAMCACWGAGAVCGGCASRGAARACRAGTGGFRPPEVLLKCPRQGTAVDMWAAGVILASVLCARYPLLRGGDDAAALAELAHLLGGRALRRAAAACGRRLLLSRERRGLCLRKLSRRLRAPAEAIAEGAQVAGFPDAAFALAARLLEPDPRARITAAQALAHPFLAAGD